MSEAEIIRAARTRLASYKVPKRVILIDELPRNALGKVQKNALRAAYAELYRASRIRATGRQANATVPYRCVSVRERHMLGSNSLSHAGGSPCLQSSRSFLQPPRRRPSHVLRLRPPGRAPRFWPWSRLRPWLRTRLGSGIRTVRRGGGARHIAHRDRLGCSECRSAGDRRRRRLSAAAGLCAACRSRLRAAAGYYAAPPAYYPPPARTMRRLPRITRELRPTMRRRACSTRRIRVTAMPAMRPATVDGRLSRRTLRLSAISNRGAQGG